MNLRSKLNAFKSEKNLHVPLEKQPTEPTKPPFVGFVGSFHRDVSKKNVPPLNLSGTPKPTNESLNPYLSQVDFQWLHSFAWEAQTVDKYLERMNDLHRRGLTMEQADHMAELLTWRDLAGDDRKLCAECSRYRHHTGTGAGLCQAAGVQVKNMRPGATVEFFRLRRCEHFEGVKR